MIRRYEIAGVGISVETDCVYSDKSPYDAFCCPQGKVHVRYHFTDGLLPQAAGRPVLRENALHIFQSEKGQRCFLLNNGEPFACSQIPKDDSLSTVVIGVEAPELWSGFVFSAIGLEHLLVRRGRLILHASYIDWNGKAILFTAPCQTGKSTQAELWRQYRGAEVINGDRVCLSADGGLGMAHGLPMAGTSGICKNRSLPMAAIVFLSQAPENSLEQLTGKAAFRAVYSGCWVNDWDREDTEAAVDIVNRIISEIPVFHLACRPDQEAVELLAAALGG